MSSPSPDLSPAARHQAAVEWNNPLEYLVEGLLPDLVASRAARRPQAVALVAGSSQVSYGELMRRAEALAGRLLRRGVGPERVVGVLLERSPEMVAALLAIWKCGGAWLPLDPDHPAERMGYILGDGLRGPDPRLVVTSPELAGRIPDPGVEPFFLDGEALEPGPPPPLLGDHPAYVIYTSGSTGRPKGIVVSHRALANRIAWAAAAEVGPENVFLHKTTLTFDVALAEIFAPLVAGGRCVLARPGGQRDLGYLADLIARERITHASFPPAALRLLLEIPEAAAKLASLRVLVTGGETVPPDLPAAVRAVLPAAVLFNRYGPTETTISVLTGACDPEQTEPILPLGRPIARAGVYVLDEDLRLLPPGSPGEICIGGICLARGYLGRPDLTAEHFVPDPIGGEPGARLYRSGDRGRWRPDGKVEFLGRLDSQVKIRGFRVELEEVEAALNAIPGVREAAVVAREEAATGSRRLVAWVIPEPGSTLDAEALRHALAGRLATYMIPAEFVACEDLPRTLSGKVDRTALLDREVPDESVETPKTDLERRIASIVQDLLQARRVGADDDLLALGFHSLLLASLQARLRDDLGAEVELADLVRNPTIAGLARILESGERRAEIDAETLAAEALLEPEIRMEPDQGMPAAMPKTIFLTGATGFLGAHLLAELLERTPARILCLVRATDEDAGRETLRRGLERYGLQREDAATRIVPVLGDLARTGLGLSGSVAKDLARTVDAIYHCGAQVHFVYPYETLRAANVGGTREILRLTVQGRPKALHYVSTLSVLERAGQKGGVAPEGPLDADATGITGGYRQSKWVAERLVQTAIERGIPAAIYRPGWITGSSSTGAANLSDFLLRLVVGSLEAGVAPDLGPIEICPTPVDWVAAGIAWLSLHPGPARVFHLIHPQPVAYAEVLSGLTEVGQSLQILPVQDWAAALAERAEDGEPSLEPLAGFLRRLAEDSRETTPDRFQPHRFASAATQDALAAGGIECPRFDRDLLALYLRTFRGSA